MRKVVWLAATMAACVSFGISGAQAHHAVQASVDTDKFVDATAVLSGIDWINPHTWLHFDIVENGKVSQQNVLVESLGIAALKLKGINSKSALKLGETFQIQYNPNRNGLPGGFLSKMVFPDGRVFEVKASDPIATQ